MGMNIVDQNVKWDSNTVVGPVTILDAYIVDIRPFVDEFSEGFELTYEGMYEGYVVQTRVRTKTPSEYVMNTPFTWIPVY